jgi:hypothetical protein
MIMTIIKKIQKKICKLRIKIKKIKNKDYH